MALEKKNIVLRLDSGIEAGSDPKTTVGLTKIQNGDWSRRGEIRKRNGQSRSAVAQAGYTQIFPYGDKLVAIGQGKALRTYDSDGDTWSAALTEPQLWMQHSTDSVLPVRAASVTDQGTNQIDVCRLGDWMFTAVLDDDRGELYVQAVNEATGAKTTYNAADDSHFRIVRMSDSLAYLYFASQSLSQARRLTLTDSGTIGSITTITTITNPDVSLTVSNLSYFDAALISSGGNDYVCCVWGDTGTAEYKFCALPDGGDASSATAVLNAPTGFGVCGIWAHGSDATVAYTDNTGSGYDIYVEDRDVAAVQQIAPWAASTVSTGTTEVPVALGGYGDNHSGAGDAGTLYVTRRMSSNDDRHTIEYDLVDNAGTFDLDADNTRELNFHALMAKPQSDGLGGWIAIMALHARQDGDLALSLTQGRSLIATYAIYSGGLQTRLTLTGTATPGDADHVERIGVHQVTTGQYGYVGLPVVVNPLRSRRAYGWGSSSYFDTGLSEWTIFALIKHTVQAIESDGVLLMSSSLPRQWHGPSGTLVERGFIAFPELIYGEAVADVGGPFLEVGGTYQYAATYEWDVDGRRHQSAPAPVLTEPSVATTSGNTTIEATVPCLTCTERTDVRIVLWRTVKDGTLLRRVAVVQNDPDDSYVVITDETLDAISQQNERLYTQDGTLESIAPGPLTQSIEYQRRNVYLPMEGTRVRYSRTKVDREPYHHNEVLRIDYPGDNNEGTALIEQGDKLFRADPTHIYATEGEGRTDIGGGSGYVRPYEISENIGCIDGRTIAKVPQGTMMLGKDGIWLLSSGTQLKPIGDPVRYYVDTYSIVKSLVLNGATKAVFLASDGPAIVLDWLRDRWAIWDGMQSVDGAALGDVLHRLDSSGYVWKQDAGHDDNGAHVSMLVETTCIAPFDLGGRGRLYEVILVGQFIEACNISVQLQFDNDPGWEDAEVADLDANLEPFDVSAYYGSGLTRATYEDQAMILRVWPPRQKFTSIRVRVQDAQNGSTVDTEGFSLSGIVLCVGMKTGPHRTGAARQVGA